MYGAVASMSLLRSGTVYTPEDADALAYANFVTQTYEVGAEPSTLTAMFSGTDAGGFSGDGMKVAAANTNRPEAAGALKTILDDGFANGITLLFEMDMETAGAGGTLLGASDPDDIEVIWLNSQPGALDNGDMDFGTNGLAMNLPGINRVAFTLSRDLGGGTWRNATSVNGSAVTTVGFHYQDLTYALADRFLTAGFAAIKIGDVADWNLPNNSEFFRKFAVYDPMDDSALAVLSSL